MARVRFFNGASTLAGVRFGDFTPGVLDEVSATRVVLTGADGQQFIAFGTGFGVNVATGKVTGRISRIDWLDPDGGLLARVDQMRYPAQRAFDALFTDPGDPGAPEGSEALFTDALSGDDLIIGGDTVGGGYYDAHGFADQFNRIFVGTGDDTVKGGAGRETVRIGDGGTVDFDGGGGSDGIDYLYASFAGDRGLIADLASGRIRNPFGLTDTVRAVENVTGTLFDDTIRGNAEANGLSADSGHDLVEGRGGDDFLITYSSGEVGPDDTLNGGSGDDSIYPDEGADRIIGGLGVDTVRYDQRFTDPQLIVLDLANPANTTGNAADDTVSGVEVYFVSWGVDETTKVRFVGDRGDNGFISIGRSADTLIGGAGDDTLDSGDDLVLVRDRLLGGSGDDLLLGGGPDLLNGGAGNDTVSFHDLATLTLDLLDPAASTGEAKGDTYVSIEAFQGMVRFFGSAGGDHAIGSPAGTLFEGRGGNDTLTGASRDDTMNGGAGNDSLSGGTLPDANFLVDRLAGGPGDDTLEGMNGLDVLSGGAGADIFFWRSLKDTGVAGQTRPADRDVVTDFGDGADLLRFRAAGFAGLDDGFRLAQGLAPTAKLAGGAFLFDTDDHLLYWDRDGSGAAAPALLMTLDDVSRLARADIDIV